MYVNSPKQPGKTLCLIDQGGCFTMVSEAFVKHHGLPLHEFTTEFQQADNLPSGKIVGKTDF